MGDAEATSGEGVVGHCDHLATSVTFTIKYICTFVKSQVGVFLPWKFLVL